MICEVAAQFMAFLHVFDGAVVMPGGIERWIEMGVCHCK
jgi:hypothetical protein